MFRKVLIVILLLFLATCLYLRVLHYWNLNERNKGYKCFILSKEDFKGTGLEKWIKTCADKSGYYLFITSDTNNAHCYVYYPNINKNNHSVNYKVNFKKVYTTMKVYLKKQDVLSDGKVTDDILMDIEGPLGEEWPSKLEVYVNGEKASFIRRDQTY